MIIGKIKQPRYKSRKYKSVKWLKKIEEFRSSEFERRQRMGASNPEQTLLSRHSNFLTVGYGNHVEHNQVVWIHLHDSAQLSMTSWGDAMFCFHRSWHFNLLLHQLSSCLEVDGEQEYGNTFPSIKPHYLVSWFIIPNTLRPTSELLRRFKLIVVWCMLLTQTDMSST